jgi:hypothetical protein
VTDWHKMAAKDQKVRDIFSCCLPMKDASFASAYGVKFCCGFTDLKYCDPVVCLRPDAMHDILLGFLKKQLEVVLHHLIIRRLLLLSIA